MIELHEEAKKNFINKLNNLYKLLEENVNFSNSRENYHSDVLPEHKIQSKNILDIELITLLNEIDEETGICLVGKNQNIIGFTGENYLEFLRIAELIYRQKSINKLISFNYIKKSILAWIKNKYFQAGIVDYFSLLFLNLEKDIMSTEVYLPLSNFCIEKDINIGNITIKPLTREIIDGWENLWKPKSSEEGERVKQFYDIFRTKYQGNAVCYFKTKAEKNRAYEIAMNESEKVINILRLFYPLNIFPSKSCHLNFYGQANIKQGAHFTFIPDNKTLNFEEYQVTKNFRSWYIRNLDMDEINNSGLTQLSSILKLESLNGFQKLLLNSIYLYSKGLTLDNINEKLVYILSALESLLLSDENESIQQNVAERIAFIVGRNYNERKDIIKNFKTIYKKRSSFVHHGQSIDELENFKNFFINVRNMFLTLVKSESKFVSRENLLEYIERIKLSN